jgi:CPA2 family monovalent cation:H+ antiporter-2
VGIGALPARIVVIAVAVALALPFCIGIVRLARRLGQLLAERALPGAQGARVDLAAAPRRALLVTLQLASVLIVGVPLLAITQPFLPGYQGAIVLAALLAVLGVGFWRSATNLQGHVRAGAEAVVEALAAQSKSRGPNHEHEIAELHALLPGIGEPIPVRLRSDSPAVGKSLADLNLRGLTGATVIAIRRGDSGVLVPTAKEVLQADDVLALAGTHEAIESARTILGFGHGTGSRGAGSHDAGAHGAGR